MGDALWVEVLPGASSDGADERVGRTGAPPAASPPPNPPAGALNEPAGPSSSRVRASRLTTLSAVISSEIRFWPSRA